MSRYEQASHVFWRCQYHIVWTPKYRFRVLKNKLGKDVYRCIHVYCQQLGCIVMELNVQIDHVHLVVKIPPKLSISNLMGALKGKIALKLFSKYPHLRKNKMWGNHFWQRGYFVDSVGINEEIIRRYVRHQEKVERQEQAQLALDQKAPFQGVNAKPPSLEGGFFTFQYSLKPEGFPHSKFASFTCCYHSHQRFHSALPQNIRLSINHKLFS